MPRPLVQWLIVGLAGSLGATARYGLYVLIERETRQPFYVDTLVVNTLGVFLLGVLSTIAIKGRFRQVRPLVLTGFLGAFTTFSTFVHDIDGLGPFRGFVLVFIELALGLSFMALGICLAERTNAARRVKNGGAP